jgi:hypothetical protein
MRAIEPRSTINGRNGMVSQSTRRDLSPFAEYRDVAAPKNVLLEVVVCKENDVQPAVI